MFAAFSKSRDNYSTSKPIADVIYQAATDGTDQIRYLAGADAERLYAAWKQMNNDDFFTMVNHNFGLDD